LGDILNVDAVRIAHYDDGPCEQRSRRPKEQQMTQFGSFPDLSVNIENYIATVEIQRPPHNYFDLALIQSISSAFEALDDELSCRVIILASEGKSFCAGAQLGAAPADGSEPPPGGRAGRTHLYYEAVRLFLTETPFIAAVQVAAIGGGLGLAMSADFRIASPESRFAANFARLGFHHGFGLTVLLPEIIGKQAAANMLMTGRRVKGEEALKLGLCDQLVPLEELRGAANELAAEIAASAPLAVRSIRRTLRQGLAERIREATDHEQVEQDWLRKTDDFREGVRATAERRMPDFKAR